MKLRLPNKLIVAIMAAAIPVLHTTIPAVTLGTVVVALAGQQAWGEGESVVPAGETVTEGSDGSRINNYQGNTVYGTVNLYLQGDTSGGNGLITLGEGSDGSIYVKKGTFALNTAGSGAISSNLQDASLHMEDGTIFRIRKGPNASTVATPVETTYVSGTLDLSVAGTSGANNSLTLTTDFLRESEDGTAKMKKTDSGGVILSGRVELDEFNVTSGYTQFTGAVSVGAFNATGGTTEFKSTGAGTLATITGTLTLGNATVNVIGGTLSAGSLDFSQANSRLSVSENAVLNIAKTQNTFKQATVNGDVHLTLNSEPTGSNSIVSLNEGSNGHIYLDGGLLALNTAGNNSSSDLKGATLHMAGGTTFRIRNGLETGEVSKVGTALLTGTVKLDIANNITTDSVITTNFKQEEGAATAKLQRTDSGKITLGGAVNLDAVEILNGTTVFAGTTNATTFTAKDNAGITTFSNIATFTTLSAANKTIILGSNGEGETGTHGTLTVKGAATIGTLNLEAGTSATFNGPLNISSALSIKSSNVTISGGEHTINKINADDSNNAADSIRLTDNATVTVSHEIQIGAQGGSYMVEQGSTLKLSVYGFRIEAAEGEDAATISSLQSSSSGGHYTYNKGDSFFTINNAKITAAYASAATIGNKLENSIVINNAAGTLTLSHNDSTLKGVYAKDGAVIVQNAGSSAGSLKSIKATGADIAMDGLRQGVSVSLNELLIGDHRTVSAAHTEVDAQTRSTDPMDAEVFADIEVTGTQEEHGTLAVGVGGATTGINLSVSGAVDYSAVPGNVLNINGGSLTLSTGSTTYLSSPLISPLDSHMMIEVMSGIGALTVGNIDFSQQIAGMSDGEMIVVGNAADYFATASGGTVGGSGAQMIFRADANGTGTLLVTPEPATATLSLLALAALAARRRRK